VLPTPAPGTLPSVRLCSSGAGCTHSAPRRSTWDVGVRKVRRWQPRSPQLHAEPLDDVAPHLLLQHVHLLVCERPVHAPVQNAVAAALAARLGVLEAVNLRRWCAHMRA
jgi:hypothetical protein